MVPTDPPSPPLRAACNNPRYWVPRNHFVTLPYTHRVYHCRRIYGPEYVVTCLSSVAVYGVMWVGSATPSSFMKFIFPRLSHFLQSFDPARSTDSRNSVLNITSEWASTPDRLNVCLRRYSIHTFVHVWPWALTSDPENIFSNSRSRDEYFWQV